MRVPWDEIEVVFLDAGNTLVSIDFPWVADELGRRGVVVDPGELERAEAAARPAVSAASRERRDHEGRDAFASYLDAVLSRLASPVADGPRRALVDELRVVLKPGGTSQRLWSRVIPGVPEALRALGERGLQRVVVSNSDGTAEATLADAGLRSLVDVVIDSHVVGVQKPDPRIFGLALERAGAAAARTLHVGDMYDIDVLGARRAGVHALLLDPFGDWDEPDCVTLPDLQALAAALP